MSYIYKQLAETIAKWPIDELKSKVRNLHYFLKCDLDVMCPVNKETGEREPPDEKKHACKRHLKGLQRLLNNELLKQYPNTKYRTGHMALTLEQLKNFNSDEGRQQLGFTRVDATKKKTWRSYIYK